MSRPLYSKHTEIILRKSKKLNTKIYYIYHTKYLKNENSEIKNQNPMGEATSGSAFMLFLFFRHISFFLQALTNFVNFLQDISLENSLRKIFVHWLRETIGEMAENSKSQLEMIPRICHVWISKKNKCKIWENCIQWRFLHGLLQHLRWSSMEALVREVLECLWSLFPKYCCGQKTQRGSGMPRQNKYQ